MVKLLSVLNETRETGKSSDTYYTSGYKMVQGKSGEIAAVSNKTQFGKW